MTRAFDSGLSCFGLVVFLGACSVEGGPDDAAPHDDEANTDDLGVVRQEQLDPGNFDLVQNGVVVGAVWRGRISTGVDVEYWVKKPAYTAGAARTFQGVSSTSCSAFRSMVCGWSGATRYKSSVTQAPLACAMPPGAITPPGGATSFLASGSYRTTNGVTPFAWTYAAGNVEYWAMQSLVPSTPGAQSPQSTFAPAYTSVSNFVSSVCALAPVPTQWITQTMIAQPSFCTANPC